MLIQSICRAALAGFSKNNEIVCAKFLKSIFDITVLYELIKGITVLCMSNQAHNCTVWFIQHSYAVDYYCMNYESHLILLHKAQCSTLQ